MIAYAIQRARWEEAGRVDPPPVMEDIAPPEGLPGEFADYLHGAAAGYQHGRDNARKAWSGLLARPAGERRYRSTWAAFMLGKSWLHVNDEEAAKWFVRTRELAREGCRDSLGLAASSYGWQGRAELNRAITCRALHLYFDQRETGDPTAVPSSA